jgi:NAD(P)-dependent dehydrogenase (short-subunit alcohol dehydrogenase family)
MKGKVVVITGSNAGIGKETAVSLAAMGATTVLACRDLEKGSAAAGEVARRSGNDAVHAVPIDLADLASVHAGARTIERSWERLDVLVNNAGGIWSERSTTAQGFEQTFGVKSPGPLLPDASSPRPPGGIGSRQGRQRGLVRPSRRPPGHAMGRSPA